MDEVSHVLTAKGTKNSKEKNMFSFLAFLALLVVQKSWRLFAAICLVALLPLETALAQVGEPQEVGHSDIVLVIDHSGSMKDNDPSYLRLAAAKLFIDLADPGDRIGIVVMSDKAATRALTKRMQRVSGETMESIKATVDQLRDEPMGEYTHMGTALGVAYNLLQSTEGSANQRQFVVLLTDGLPTPDTQHAVVDQVATQFALRRFWKVFSIALGANADPGYLQQHIAAPTGSEVLVARNANELFDRYIDIYTRAGDDRYVERIALQPNTLAPLLNVRPDQRLTQMSIALLRGERPGRINSLAAPGEFDLVQPFYQNTIYHTDEPEYELYTISPQSQIPLVGKWQVNIAQADPAPATLVVLSRSRLRLQMPSPVSLQSEDDNSLRYWPVGRPLLLVAGAKTSGANSNWVRGMAPAVRALAAEVGPWVRLTDDGREYDMTLGDGQYSGLLPPFAAEGDYTLQVEMPQRWDSPIHIRRDYTIRVASLPTMTLTLPNTAATLPVDTVFSGQIELPARADFPIKQVTFPFAFVMRPDGVVDPLQLQRDAEGRYSFQYRPSYSGSYRISVAAEVHGRGPMGAIRYVDYVEGAVSVPEPVPRIAIGMPAKYRTAFE